MTGLGVYPIPPWLNWPATRPSIVGEVAAIRAQARSATRSPTVTIDTESDPGAWEAAIAHTPHLQAQIDDEAFDRAPAQDPNVND